jgi:hypothetical protein
MLLDKGVEVNAQGGWYGNTPQAASERGHETVVQMLLDKGGRKPLRNHFYKHHTCKITIVRSSYPQDQGRWAHLRRTRHASRFLTCLLHCPTREVFGLDIACQSVIETKAQVMLQPSLPTFSAIPAHNTRPFLVCSGSTVPSSA